MKSFCLTIALSMTLMLSTACLAQTEKDSASKAAKPAATPAKAVNPACGTCAESAAGGCCTPNSAAQSPILLALDLDKDGEISASEIKNATASLSALDTDGNGKLCRKEMFTRSQFSQVNSSGKSGLQLGVTMEYYVEKMVVMYDKNDNNRLEKSEMPETMSSVLHIIDENRDDVLAVGELVRMNDTIAANAHLIGKEPAPTTTTQATPTTQRKPKSNQTRRVKK